MDNKGKSRRLLDAKLEGIKRVGRPNLRWMDGVVEDLRKSGIQRWWLVARDRQLWKVLRLVVGCTNTDDDVTYQRSQFVTPYDSRKPISEGFTVFWNMTPCGLVEGINVSEGPAPCMFWVEDRLETAR
jgi:hypothetical protein